MVTKKPHFNKKKIPVLALLFLFATTFIIAQEENLQEQEKQKNYFLHTEGEETYLYQTIQWKPGNLVKHYHVKLEILTDTGEWIPYEAKLPPKDFFINQTETSEKQPSAEEDEKIIVHETEYIGDGLYKTTDTKITVSLFAKESGEPQKYRYTITVFNILGHPSFTTEPMEFQVRKAYIPEITSISKEIIYLDTLYDGNITIRGINLMDTTQIFIKDGLRRVDPISVEFNDEETRADIVFDQEIFDVGNWSLTAVNQGDFKAEIPLVIKFIKWYDLNLSLGYSPQIVVFDDTIKEFFGKRFIAGSINFRLGFYPIKRRFGYLGFGLSLNASRLSSTYDTYNLSTNFITGTALGYYRRPIIQRQLYVEIRAGGGVTFIQGLQFEFPHNLKSEYFNSMYFAAQIGGSVAYTLWHGLYVDVGADITASFIPEMPIISISPSISVGWTL